MGHKGERRRKMEEEGRREMGWEEEDLLALVGQSLCLLIIVCIY